ncbi:hypothetical protein BHM03_00002702 [Ensete ventricosum]|nr:hypothetical protein BHM03_00002702 [Ensete ventricosum]
MPPFTPRETTTGTAATLSPPPATSCPGPASSATPTAPPWAARLALASPPTRSAGRGPSEASASTPTSWPPSTQRSTTASTSFSFSLGGLPSEYFENSLDIGAFHAVKKGITVVCPAGNSGPDNSTVTNVAPWILTVGASTLDRDFPADVVFGNKRVTGKSLSEALPGKKLYPLINSKEANHGNVSKEKA